MFLHPNAPSSPRRGRTWLAAVCLGCVPILPAAEPASAPAGAPRINLESIVKLTYENNLRITVERFDLESAELSFERFMRNNSSFIPLIVDTNARRETESEIVNGVRESERSYAGGVSVGLEKEFFDGTNIGAEVGVSATRDSRNRKVARPYVEVGVRMPLMGSITRLERTIERTFEETELFRAWLGFIQGARNAIRNSLRQYVFLQQNIEQRRLLQQVIEEYRQLETHPALANRTGDLAQIRAQIQDFQSDLAGLDGQIENNQISLIDNIGLETLSLGQVEPLSISPANLYGVRYLQRPAQEVIAEAFENDIEIQVLRIQRSNEELELELALRGKWDISGRATGSYDFPARGDDPSRRGGYEIGLGISVQRNDPRLLDLSVRQSRADIGQLDAEIALRNRELSSEIRRSLNQADSTRRVIQELTMSSESRLNLYRQELTEFLAGTETVENLIQARRQLFMTTEDLTEEVFEFYDVALDLDEASGQFFVQLGDLVPQFESFENNGGSVGGPRFGR